MKTKKLYQKLVSKFAWILAVALLLPVNVGAATTEVVDTDAECSINVVFTPGSTTFKLYRVASINEQTKFTLVDPFTAYSVEVNDLDADGYSGLATTLANYASTNNLAATKEGTTDASGNLTFDGLETGMYLLTGAEVTIDKEIYTPTASIVVVPTWATPADGEDLAYDYNPTVSVKYGSRRIADEEYLETTNFKVSKEWNYSKVAKGKKKEAREDQPTEISVSILQDGQVYSDGVTTYSNVILNASNSWSVTLTNLDANHTYSAIENDVDSNYTVSTSQTSNVVTLTNTHKKVKDDDYNDTTEADDDSSSSSGTKLPQTGQLWWPVPVLALAGLVLFGAGSFRRSRSGKKED